eukprot:COSAG01_NODE_1260_length_11008_cov_96.487208_13_plen_65_part_00
MTPVHVLDQYKLTDYVPRQPVPVRVGRAGGGAFLYFFARYAFLEASSSCSAVVSVKTDLGCVWA